MKKRVVCMTGAVLLVLLPEGAFAYNGSIPPHTPNGGDYRLLLMAAVAGVIWLGCILYWNSRIRNLNVRLEHKETELAQLGGKLEENEALYHSVLNASLDGIVLLDKDGTILMASLAARDMLGADGEEPLLGRRLESFISEADRDNLKHHIEEILQGIKGGARYYNGSAQSGGQMVLEINSELVSDGRRQEARIVSVICDVTQQQMLEKELRLRETQHKDLSAELKAKNELLKKTASVDCLTGLRNRHYFEQRMSEEVAFAQRYKCGLALIVFKPDHFKSINDRYGHDAGDGVLVRIAATISLLIRKSDIFARWGGEEFVLLMPLMNLEEAKTVAEKLRAAIADIKHPGNEAVSICMGLSVWKEPETAMEWFSRTDQALYQAKNQGRDKIVISDGQDAMAADIVSWSEDWECGNEVIDRQHRELLFMGNDLILTAIDHNKRAHMLDLLQKLIDHITLHFRDEELLLSEYGYSELEQHRGVHYKLLNQAHMLLDQLCRGAYHPDEVVRFVIGDFITGHLLQDDTRFFYLF